MATLNLGLSQLVIGGSLQVVGTTLQFTNDSVSPGNNYFYGTGPTGTKGFFTLASAGVTSLTGTAGQVTVSAAIGAITLSLPTTLTSINSITAAASTDLTLAAGSGTKNVIINPSTLGGDSGGWLLLNAGAVTTPVVNGSVGQALAILSTSTAALRGGFLAGSPFGFYFQTNLAGYPIILQPVTGNLLVGGTTDITGSGGLKVFGTTASTSPITGAFRVGNDTAATTVGIGGGNVNIGGTTASTSTTTGSLINAGGFGNAGAAWFGGDVNTAGSLTSTGGILALGATPSTTGAIRMTNNSFIYYRNAGNSGNYLFGGISSDDNTYLISGVGQTINLKPANTTTALTASTTVISIPLTTTSTSTTTGALVVSGGAGIAGATWVGGLLNVAGAATISSVSGNVLTVTSAQTNATNIVLANTDTGGTAWTMGSAGSAAGTGDAVGTFYIYQGSGTKFKLAPTTGNATLAGNLTVGNATGSATFGIATETLTIAATATGAGTITTKSGQILTLATGTAGVTMSGTGNLITSGGWAPKIAVVTTSTVLDTSYHIVVANSGAPMSLTLPSSPVTGQTYTVKSKGVGQVTLIGNGANLFTNTPVATFVMNTGDANVVSFDGTVWIIV